MNRLPQVTAPEMIAALIRAGFVVARVKGSHHFLVHQSDPTRWDRQGAEDIAQGCGLGTASLQSQAPLVVETPAGAAS
jgi:predicted RNA binding protein YcfA (HicA-like mRNA interferase family)